VAVSRLETSGGAAVTDSPPLAPDVPLSGSQLAFLELHTRHIVTEHRWHFQETQLRAKAGTRTATVSAEELGELIRWDLMEPGSGYADVRATAAGRALVGEPVS
jgi:hypothetical protein